MDNQSLISGYTSYADAEEIVPAAEAPAATWTTVTTSSQACISAASAVSAVSIDNTFDHSC
ncbi:LxmA leader domain family RiPP [Streptomyces sp. JNUCC 64]